jgi:hypothetical protein
MKLDVLDTIKSSFSRIGSRATLAVVGASILLGLVVLLGLGAGSALMTMSGILGSLVMIVTFGVYITGLASVSVGALRAFNQEDFSKEMFTDNIAWPFLRMTGSHIVIQAFMFTVAYALLYPALLAGMAGSGIMSMASTGISTTGTGAAIGAGAGLAGVLAFALILYVLSALLLSLPRIAVDNKRLFQALDESVQSTKGNRTRIIAALLPFAVFMAAAFAGIFTGGLLGGAIYLVSSLVSSIYFLSLLTELNTRLQ